MCACATQLHYITRDYIQDKSACKDIQIATTTQPVEPGFNLSYRGVFSDFNANNTVSPKYTKQQPENQP